MTPPAKNSSLRPTLLSWQVCPPADPGFRSAVWSRIEGAREWAELTWSGYLRRHLVVWVLVLVGVGVGAGALGLGAGAKHSAADRDLVLAGYVAAIDARAMEP